MLTLSMLSKTLAEILAAQQKETMSHEFQAEMLLHYIQTRLMQSLL